MAEKLTYESTRRYLRAEIAKAERAVRLSDYERKRLDVMRGVLDAIADKRDVPATNAAPRALREPTEPYIAPRAVHWNRAALQVRSPWRARLEEEN